MSTPPWALTVSRSHNRAISRILKAYPNKFIAIAAAPLQDIPAAIVEAEFAVRELGLHWMIIYQSINGKDLDGEFLWPFYAAVEKLGVPLSVHGVDSGPLLGVERFAARQSRRLSRFSLRSFHRYLGADF